MYTVQGCFGEFKFTLTHNVLEGKESRERTAEEKKTLTNYFELFDDDGDLYFRGYSSDGESEDAFIPLDWASGNFGCTYIKYRNRNNGKMEIL